MEWAAKKRKRKPASLSEMVVNFDVGRVFSECSLWIIRMAGRALEPGLLASLYAEE